MQESWKNTNRPSTSRQKIIDETMNRQHRRVSVKKEDHSDENASVIASRVPVIPSLFLNCFVKQFTVRVTVDSGATGNAIRHDVAKSLNLTFH